MSISRLSPIIRGFAGVAALRLIGIPLAIVANIVLARSLTVAEFGVVAFTISLVTVLAIPVTGGLPMLLLREVAHSAQRGEWSACNSIVSLAHKWVAAMTVLVCIGLLGWWLLTGRTQPMTLIFIGLVLPILGLGAIRGGILRGLGYPILAELPLAVLQPSLLAAGYLIIAALGISSAGNALWSYFAANLVIYVVGVACVQAVQPPGSRGHALEQCDTGRWLWDILSFTLLSASTTIGSQLAILLLGVLGNNEAVAQMSVAQRVAVLVGFPLSFMGAVLGPHLAREIAADDASALRRTLQHAARVSFCASLPLAFMLAAFGEPLLSLIFGQAYGSTSYLPLLILVGAQLGSAALGAPDYLLALSGHEKLSILGQLLGMVLVAVIGFAFIPHYGAVSAAAAAAIGMLTPKLFASRVAWRKIGVRSGVL